MDLTINTCSLFPKLGKNKNLIGNTIEERQVMHLEQMPQVILKAQVVLPV